MRTFKAVSMVGVATVVAACSDPAADGGVPVTELVCSDGHGIAWTGSGWTCGDPVWIDVRRLGARGNALTASATFDPASSDDTAAINAALDRAGRVGSGTVYLPAGAYRLTASLEVPAGVAPRR